MLVRSASVDPGRPVVYIDGNPLYDRHLTGIGRYTARLALALGNVGADVRFFSLEREVVPPAGLDWASDQDLKRWGHQVWKGNQRPLRDIPAGAIGLYTCTRPAERMFPFEASVLHDFTPLVVPWTHADKTRRDFQFFFGKALLSSDAAIAVSHSTKADAGWLTDFDPGRIEVAHSGPTICLDHHLHEPPVARRPEVGLVVSTLEPRKNAFFLLDWFRSTTELPEGSELWWVGPMGWLISRKQLRAYQRLQGRRIRFLGVVSDQELCRLYQQVGWSVYPSLYEGFGFPVLDALRHGTPVLTSGNSSIREFESPGLYFFDPHVPATLDRAFRTHREAGQVVIPSATLDAHFHWGRVARQVLNLPELVRHRSVHPVEARAGAHLAA